jgi:hypothetical protein
MQPSELQAAWQSQPSQLSPHVLERIHNRIRVHRRERLTSLLGVPFLVVVTGVFALAAIFAENALVSAGCAIFSASWAYSMLRMLRVNWASDATSTCVDHHCAHLIRLRDNMRGFPLWNGLPGSIGVALATLGWHLSEPNRVFDVAMPAVFWVGLQIALWAGHQKRISHLQKQLDAIDAY